MIWTPLLPVLGIGAVFGIAYVASKDFRSTVCNLFTASQAASEAVKKGGEAVLNLTQDAEEFIGDEVDPYELILDLAGEGQRGGGSEGWTEFIEPRTADEIVRLNDLFIRGTATPNEWKTGGLYYKRMGENFNIRGEPGLGLVSMQWVNTWPSWAEYWQSMGYTQVSGFFNN